MKVYIAGKITGFPKYKEVFNKAEEYLKTKGHVCMNPAILPEGFEPDEYLTVCFSMLSVCDVVYMLSNWKDSRGAKMGHKFAQEIGKKIVYEEDGE